MTKIFLSYARGDDEPFVRRLYDDLKQAGIDVWFDRVDMPSRQLTFYQEIADAIRVCDRLILVAGPKSALSDYVRQEWRWALELDKIVIPILRLGNVEEHIPGELSLLHCDDFRDDAHYQTQLTKLIENLHRPEPPLGGLFGVPSLPAHFLSRPELLRRVKDALLVDLQKPVVITGTAARVGMQGMGGIGKSVLAAALARDREIRRSYPDAVLWVAVGQQPDLVKLQRDVSKHLGGPDDFKTIEQGLGALRQLLAQKAVLLVLDDIWNTRDAQAFDVLGARCRALITTRDAGVLHTLHGEGVQVSLFTETEALHLLADAVEVERSALPPEAREVVKECGCLPLAVALCGGMVKKRGGDWSAVLQRLKRADLEKIADGHVINEQHRSIWRAMQVSMDALPPEEQRRFVELAVFATDRTVPEAAVRTLWAHTGGMDDLDTTDLIINLFERSLIQLDQKASPPGNAVERRFRLHDLLHDFATRKAGEPKVLHQTLLDAYLKQCPGGWHTGQNDGYFFQYICHHLGKSGKEDERVELLCDLHFIEAKCRAGLTYELVKDYDDAIRELPEGKKAREEEEEREKEVKRYTEEIIEYARKWSEARDRYARDPINHPLPKPEDIPLPEIIQSVKHWTDEEIEADTQRIINNPTRLDRIKVFSQFVSGEAHNLIKYSSYPQFCIQQAYNSADAGPVHDTANRILEKDSNTITILHKKSSLPPFNPHPGTLRTLEGHTGYIHAVSLTLDGRRAISGSVDNTLRVWDIETGRCLRTLEGHTYDVEAVSLTPDGHRAVSGSWDGTLRVWDIETGQCLRTLEGHTYDVQAVSLTLDGRRAVSGCGDKTMRVLDVETGQCLRTLKGHRSFVTAVSLTPDGHRAVSGSRDKTLRVWDVETWQCLRTLVGHTSWVTVISLTSDGRRAVSGSEYGTLLVWDVESGHCMRILERHIGSVHAVSLMPDGHRAVSGSSDKTLRVWDVESGQCLAMIALFASIYAVSIKYPHIIVGLSSGKVDFLEIKQLEIGKPIITPIRLWLYGMEGKQGRWDDNITALCEWCGRRFVVFGEILDVIRSINRNGRLSYNDSPCLKLPKEAWDEPKLNSQCPHCQKPLKFNPFVVDNRERH